HALEFSNHHRSANPNHPSGATRADRQQGNNLHQPSHQRKPDQTKHPKNLEKQAIHRRVANTQKPPSKPPKPP
ncbi:hypothetical protein, partial [Bifidobacterium pullorum]|uniref:hypothetical protein n=1 Tax=Bifidobacterium pullorum TaxID=78448 RepID=UPI0019552F46